MRPVGIALFLIAVAAVCQDRPECAKAADRLHSDSPGEKAWGAQLAANCHDLALASDIADELDEANPAALSKLISDSPQVFMAHALLDPLIRLRAPVKESLLAAIVKGFPTEGTIPLLQNAFANRVLLAEVRTDREGTGEWVAASNALAAMRADGFAATLLSEVKLTHSGWITDNGEAPGRGYGGSLGSGSPTFNVPLGFPPVPFYRLTALPKDGDELISDGARPIYAQRKLIEPGVNRELRWTPEGYCLQCLRIDYLSELSYLPRTAIARAIEPQTSLRWSTLDRLNTDVSRALSDQILAVKELAKSLVSSGAMKSSELGMSLQIDVRLEDQRSDQSQPLPTIPPVKFVLP
jgi:hypothetical protein